MAIYYIIYLILFFCGMVEISCCIWRRGGLSHYGRNVRKWCTAISFAIVAVAGILRSENFGVDTGSYYMIYFYPSLRLKINTFLNIGSWLRGYMDDVGFNFISTVITTFTDDYWVYRSVLYLLSLSVWVFMFYKSSKYVSVSIMIFYTIMTYNQFFLLRMSTAMMVCVWANKYIKQDKLGKAVTIIILATFIHKTALVFFLPVIIRFVIKRKLTFLQIIALALSAGVFFLTFSNALQVWYGGEQATISTEGGGTNLLFFLIAIITVVSYFVTKNKAFFSIDDFYDYNCFVCVIFVQIGALFWTILTRAKDYFFVQSALVIPNVILSLKTRKNKLLFLCLMTVMCMFYFFRISGMSQFEYFMHDF
ncbi:MAG: EpsG family protein [Clostridium sp.]|nr:EpsG family protein [Clostridium sp.]